MNEFEMNARKKSLENLTNAMDEDEMMRVPGFTISVKPEPASPEPALPTEGPGKDHGVGGNPDDPFEQLLMKKRMGR
jgi:hypothetical protein